MINTQQSERAFGRVHTAARAAAGAMLAAAALLKAYGYVTTPSIAQSHWQLVQAVAEWVLGLGLLAGLWVRLTSAIAVLAFGLFTCVAFYLAVRGDRSCGCFGPVQVAPWYTTAADALVLLGLLITMKRWLRAAAPPSAAGRQIRLCAAIILAAALPLGVLAVQMLRGGLAPEEEIQEVGGVTIVEPARSLGKSPAILPFIEINARLEAGTRHVIFYHHDCPDCASLLRQIAAGTHPLANSPTLVLVAVPPHDETELEAELSASGIVMGRLPADREWFMATAVMIVLDAGRATQVLSQSELTRQ